MDRYTGPSNEELLDCVLPCLPEIERPYWEELRKGRGGAIIDELVTVYLVFETFLKETGIETYPSRFSA